VNSEGLQCIVEDDGKARCRPIPEDTTGSDEYVSECDTNSHVLGTIGDSTGVRDGEGSSGSTGHSSHALFWLLLVPLAAFLICCGVYVFRREALLKFFTQPAQDENDKAYNLLA